jgi:23S rRNA (adenine2503-C2)-methyltransferase
MMPIEKAYSIVDVLSEIRKYDFTGQRRVSFEYTMFKGKNDTPRHAAELKRLLDGLECRMNLIRFHSIPDVPLEGSSDDEIEKFQSELSKRGVLATIRKSRGEDIFAACGLLSTMKKNNEL